MDIDYCIKFNTPLLSAILLFGCIAYANASRSLHSINSDVVVGLLKTEEEKCLHVFGSSKDVYEMFNDWGVKTVSIDYDRIINLKKIEAELLNLVKQDEISASKVKFLDKIKVKVEEFIKMHKINRIFIPGNYCNLHSKSLLPPITPYRQLVTEAIVKIVNDSPTIHLLSIFGELRDIMDIKEIEVVSSVSNLVSNGEKQRSDLKSASSNPQQEGVSLQRVKIVPNSHLAEVLAKFLPHDENGWLSIYLPDAYSKTVSNTPKNRRKLELLGYKVVAFSSDGTIEAIEDKHGNIYFRIHPETLILKPDKNSYLSNYKARQVSMLVAIAIINDFLYRT